METFAFGTPADLDQADGSPATVYMLGCQWRTSVAGTVTGGRWRCPTGAPGVACNIVLYRLSDQQMLASTGGFTPTTGVDNDISFITPASVAAYDGTNATTYVIAVLTDRYAYTVGGWPFTTDHLTAPSGVNGRLKQVTAGNPAFPDTIHGSAVNFFVGPLFEPGADPGSVDLTPADTTLAGVAVDPVPGPVAVNLTPADTTVTGVPVDPVPLPGSVDLTPADTTVTGVPVDPVAVQPASVDLTPADTTVTGVAVDPVHGGPGLVNLTPAGITLTAKPVTATGTGTTIMAISPQHVTMIADTVITLIFDEDFAEIEVLNVDGAGAAPVYFRCDGEDPVPAADGNHVLPGQLGIAVIRRPRTSGPTEVRLISSGTPKVSVRGID